MRILHGLNSDCEKLLPKTEEVFLFDDDHTKLLFWQILEPDLKRTVGLQSFSKYCTQISFYEMPDGAVCAVAYPSSTKVNYDKFDKYMKKLFSHVVDARFEDCPYMFQLFCEKHGHTKRVQMPKR
jgi:hypothetical protein